MNSIGFVGTADNLTPAQANKVRLLLSSLKPRYVHHGDCLGSDEDVHRLAVQTPARIVAHPPLDSSRRAHLAADLILRPVGYVTRFRTIVACSELLFVAVPAPGSKLRRGMVDLVHRGVAPGATFVAIKHDGRLSKRRGRGRKGAGARFLRAVKRKFKLP